MTTSSTVGTIRTFSCLSVGILVMMLGSCSAGDNQTASNAAEKPVADDKAKTDAGRAWQEDGPVPGDSQNPEAAIKEKVRELEMTEESSPLDNAARDLGQPLVENPEKLVRLSPDQPVWVDPVKKQVVLLGAVCKADYPLEFFATYGNRAYEAVMTINVTPWIVHSGLLFIGAVPGRPAQFQPEFVPPTGTEVAIEVRWKDANGKIQSCPAQHWIRNVRTKKELDTNWVFAGSIMSKTNGKEQYLADSGELICVLNLPTAMLDLPIRSQSALESRQFEAFTEHLPPPGMPITVLLKPILEKKTDAGSAAKK